MLAKCRISPNRFNESCSHVTLCHLAATLLALMLASCSPSPVDPGIVESSVDDQLQSVLSIVKPVRALGLIETANHIEKFEVTNLSVREVTIDRLEKSCGCVTATLDRVHLSPGESAKLSLSLAAGVSEERSASVTLHTTDPDDVNPRVVVSWKAQAPVTVLPDVIDFGIVRPVEPVTRILEVTRDRTALAADVLGAGFQWTAREQVAIERLKQEDTGDLIREHWEVTLLPDPSSNVTHDRLALPYGANRTEVLLVPVRWTVKAVVQAAPAKLFLGVGKPGTPFQASLTLSADPDIPLDIANWTWGEENIGADIALESLSENSTRLSLTGRYPESPGVHQTTLIVRCIQPDEPRVEIPVSCLVR